MYLILFHYDISIFSLECCPVAVVFISKNNFVPIFNFATIKASNKHTTNSICQKNLSKGCISALKIFVTFSYIFADFWRYAVLS